MTVQPGDVLRVTAQLRWPGGVIQNVFYCRNISQYSCTDAEALGAMRVWMGRIYEPLWDWISYLVYGDTIKVYNMTQDQPVGEQDWLGGPSGGDETDPLPSGVAALLKAVAGIKRGLGKKFIGMLGEDAITMGRVVADLIIDLAAAGAKWLEGVSNNPPGVSWQPGLWRKKTNTFHPLIAAVVNDVPAYQRRRKEGVGR